MPLVFLNGSSPDFMGYLFTTTADLINTLEATLQSAGWATQEKAGDGLTLLMRGTTSVNSHTCFVEFKVSTDISVANGFFLDQRGFHDAARSQGSPANVLRHTFVVGKPNRLWVTADNDSGCMAILDATNTMRGSHFGFLNRIDSNDRWAWMIGWIHVRGYQFAYVARSGFNSTNWRLLSDDYSAYTSTANGGNQIWPVSTFDFMQRGLLHSNGYLWTATQHVFYNPMNGRLNYTGRPIIDPYCYQEGRGSATNYSTSVPPLYFRGLVKHAYCGVASLSSGAQVVDTSTARILSVGSAGAWQGMRIN